MTKDLGDKLNVLVMSPSKRHTCPASVLYGISKSEVPTNVYVLDSDRNQESVYRNPKINSMIKSSLHAPIEPIFEDSDKEKYLSKLDEAIERFGIDYIIPTSERGVKLISAYDKYAPFRFVASDEIITMLQDKFDTYAFIKENMGNPNIMVPEAIATSEKSLDDIEYFIKNHGEVFVKPSHDKSGGGVGMGFVKSIGELYDNFSDFGDKNYVISEKLFLPELSHIAVVKDGKVLVQSSGKSLEKIGFSASKRLKTIEIPELNEFTEDMFDSIKENFPDSSIDGVYNTDILFDANGDMVLSEVNPGRLPGGLELSINAGLNYSDVLLKLFSNQSIGELSYKKDFEHQIY